MVVLIYLKKGSFYDTVDSCQRRRENASAGRSKNASGLSPGSPAEASGVLVDLLMCPEGVMVRRMATVSPGRSPCAAWLPLQNVTSRNPAWLGRTCTEMLHRPIDPGGR